MPVHKALALRGKLVLNDLERKVRQVGLNKGMGNDHGVVAQTTKTEEYLGLDVLYLTCIA